MPVKMKVKGIKETFDKLRTQMTDELNVGLQKATHNMKNALEDATPVDTGFARSEWTLEKDRQGYRVFNDTPYLPRLNDGHSQQAPRRFIEKTAIKYGTPLGAIVETIPGAQ